MFQTERSMVSRFVSTLRKHVTWGPVGVIREFYYVRGRADIVALTSDGRIIAFEAKLTRWKQALDQAYRNLCFAHSSFTLLPKHTAHSALRAEGEFRRRGVGICYLEGDQIVVLLDPASSEPLQPWLAHLVTTTISGGCD